jgi:DNA-binding XRE family transcriptional regulator
VGFFILLHLTKEYKNINSTTVNYNNLEAEEFSIIEQKLEIREFYLKILNTIITVRKDSKMTIEYVAKALDRSKATISLFENKKQIDYELLARYAAIFDYRVSIELFKLSHSDILRK